MSRTRVIVLLSLCYAFVTAVQLAAPFDIDNRDQALQGLYVIDFVRNGSFFVPTAGGLLTTKPPLYTWVAGAVSLVGGKVTDLTIKLPAIFSGLGVVIVTFLIGEMLFSTESGLFASLVLISTFHFILLTCIARTDMMLCFFISLSLYFFLLSYRRRSERSVPAVFVFVAISLGSITKGPVAFLLSLLVIFVFLFFMRDFKWLKSMQLGPGITLWLLILLGWFIPALIIGGRPYFHTLIFDEMVNYTLGIKAQPQSIKPYFFIAHFFEKSLPWSLFVPSGIAWYWKTRDLDEKRGLLFPIVWFLTTLTFFSLSKGRRSDYILPLYPAASLIAGHFWFSLIQRPEPGHWKGHLRTLSFGYFIVSFFMIGGLIALVTKPELGQLFSGAFPRSAESVGVLLQSISKQRTLFLSIGLPFAAASIFGGGLALRGNLKSLFLILFTTALLNSFLNVETLSPEARRRSGEQKKAFCSSVVRKIDSAGKVQFYHVEDSILFYLGRNVRPLKSDEILEFFVTSDNPFLVTTEVEYLALRERTGLNPVVLVESEYLAREKTRYVLMGRGKAPSEKAP